MKAMLLSCLLGGLALIPSVVAQRASSSSTKVAAAADMTKYIGLRHGPSLPDSLKDIGGALVSEVGDSKEYGISEIHKGKVKMLWFERLTHRDDAGVPFWEVEDILVLPPVRKNQIMVYSMCFLGNKPDIEIVAIADYQPDVEFFTRVRRAWRANRKTEKFEEISFKGIKCTNEGYGV